MSNKSQQDIHQQETQQNQGELLQVQQRSTLFKCPQCNKIYSPTFADSMSGTETDKEQHLSGLCSDHCWDKFLGLY